MSKTSSPPLLVFADDWGRHPSSCQHLIRRLRKDCPVLWANSIGTRQVRANGVTFRRGWEKVRNWMNGLKQVDDQMWVIDLPMLPGLGNAVVRGLNRRLVTFRLRQVLRHLQMPRPVVLTTLPYIDWLIQDLDREALVYYCTDDYSHWPSADGPTLAQADREMGRRADLVLAASKALLARHADAGRCGYFPHGVDFSHFASAQQTGDTPDEIARLPQPRIGFFGLIYEKLDFDLLAAVARRFAHGSLVMIGPTAFCPPEFASIPNVHFLGKKNYEELPRFLAGLDVLLMPYRMDDEMIRQSGPLKLRECLASGKPTVSIDVPEVRILEPHVRVAAGTETFLRQVEEALADKSPAADRQRSVEQDGWDSRAQLLRSSLAELRASPTPAASAASQAQTPPRVLHLRTVTGKGGGPEKTLLNSPRHLEGQYQLRLAYIRPEGDRDYDMPERARDMGVDLVDVPERSGADPRTLWRLAREIQAFRPHILHAHDYKTDLLAVLLGRWYRIPVMTTMHGYVTRGGRLEAYYWLDNFLLRRMDHVIAVSQDLYDHLAAQKVPPSRCSLVDNAIDTTRYIRRSTPEEAKQRLGIPATRLTIGAIGRLSPEKGFDVLIQAVDRLLAEGLDVELFIVGEGDDRPRLEECIGRLNRNDRVRLLGYRSDVPALCEAMDVFAMSSLREGLPNVLLEAMAMEVPVAATTAGGIGRLIQDGENGLLVEPGDPTALATALGRLLRDPDLRARYRQAGRQTVEHRFSFEARMRKVRAIYDSLLRAK